MTQERFHYCLSWFLCVSAILMAGAVLVIVGRARAQDGQILALADAGQPAKPAAGQPGGVSRKELIEKLEKDNRFVNPPAEPQPPGQVLGILGDKALFPGDQWAGVGDTVPPGAKVLEITATQVTIDWKGEKRTLYPIMASIAQKVAPKAAPAPVAPPVSESPAAPGDAVAAPAPVAITGTLAELDWLDVPPHLKDYLLTEWNKLTDKEKADARVEWEKAPPEEKAMMIIGLEGEMERKQAMEQEGEQEMEMEMEGEIEMDQLQNDD